MLLELHKIAKLYGAKVIFKDVSLSLVPGSITLLVGANGAGKSTLLRIMAGLSQASTGRVERGVTEARLGYLGHATFLYPALTALENLAFWRDLYSLSLPDTALENVLERVELRRHAHQRAGVFSRGMAQRLNLARVLLLEPELLLLDEPGTGLDVRSAGLLRREVVTAKARGAAVVWISHDVAGDAPLADRLLALENKHLGYDGSPSTYGASAC